MCVCMSVCDCVYVCVCSVFVCTFIAFQLSGLCSVIDKSLIMGWMNSLIIGMNVEGLFRVPGPAQHIEELRKDFEEGSINFTKGILL